MKTNIENLILNQMGVTNGAIKLAKEVYGLQEKNPNIDRVSFSRYSLKGYAGIILRDIFT